MNGPHHLQGALSCKDVVLLIADLLGHTHQECLEQLCNHMGVPVPELPSESSGSEDDDEPWTHLPVSEMDLTTYEQCTPSYRAFPSERPKDRCTVRVPIEAAMLNDNWVSVPTGSEEDFFFKNTRKNMFEEALFRCEDEQVRISSARAHILASPLAHHKSLISSRTPALHPNTLRSHCTVHTAPFLRIV